MKAIKSNLIIQSWIRANGNQLSVIVASLLVIGRLPGLCAQMPANTGKLPECGSDFHPPAMGAPENFAALTGSSVTTTALQTPSPALPADGSQSSLPTTSFELQVVRLADDDGSRQCPVQPGEIIQEVACANSVFAAANIQFAFDPARDFSDVNSSALNGMMGTTDTTNTVDANWPDELATGNAVAASYPGKMVIMYRTGPPPSLSEKFQSIPGGFGWWDYNFTAACTPGDVQSLGIMPTNYLYYLLAHELGHHLGLPHTFGGLFDTTNEAAADFASRGNNPNVYDGDGFSDTPPHPSVRTMEFDGPPTLVLNGVTFLLPRLNIMSYYWEHNSITPMQAARASWMAQNYMANGLLSPSNLGVSNPIEAENLGVSSSQSVSYGVQDMSGFFANHNPWSAGSQLFLGFSQGGQISLLVNVSQTGTYYLSVYGTKAPDFGIVQFSVDNTNIGALFDAYAPLVLPSAQIPLGTVNLTAGTHVLKVQNAGKNALAVNYYFGLDCLQLQNLEVASLPVIQRAPLTQTLSAGQTATLSIGAMSPSMQPLSYIWKKNGANIPGATGAVLTLTNLQLTDAGQYSVSVSNTTGVVTSSNATLSVNSVPSRQRFEGEALWADQIFTDVYFIQDMTGFGPYWSGNAQIFFDMEPWDSLTLRIPITYSGTYHLAAVFTQAPDLSDLQCYLDGSPVGPVISCYNSVVLPTPTNDLGTVTLSAGTHDLAVEYADSNPLTSGYWAGLDFVDLTDASIGFSAQPQGDCALAGQAITLSSTAQSPLSLGYQWFKNGVAVPNATNISLFLGNLKTSDAGFYTVLASNSFFSQMSPPVNVAVLSLGQNGPAIVANHFTFGITGGSGGQFKVDASPDLRNWTTMTTNVFPTGLLQVIDPAPANQGQRYYRVHF